MLTRKQKEELVKELTKQIQESKTVVVCDFKGLTVKDMSEVRKGLREKGAEMKVVKKSLATLAFKEAGIELNAREYEGQLAFVYGGESEVASPKVLVQFSKTNENLKVLAGALENRAITAEEVVNLSKLPSQEELLARVVGTIKAPISGFVQALSGNLKNLVYVLNAVKDTKQQ